MKKILLATTAVMMSAGYAAADVAVSGDARFGLLYVEGAADEATVTGRLRIKFSASGETDSGLSFGGSVRADNSIPAKTDLTAGEVFISGDFGTLTVGDTDNAAKKRVGNVSGVGLTGLGDANELGFITGADPHVRFDYEAGDIGVSISTSDAEEFALGVSYSFGDITASLGYEAADVASLYGVVVADATAIHLGVNATFGDATVKARINSSEATGVDAVLGYAVSVDYAFGATVVTAFYADFDESDAAGLSGRFGLGAVHDLGGGLKLKGGIVSQADETMTADFGVSMDF